MPNDVQMSIKLEAELRDRFMAAAAVHHRPAAQVIRELMRRYVAENEEPNALTAQTLRKGRRGEDVFHAADEKALLDHLGL